MTRAIINLHYEEPLPTTSRRAFLMEDEIRRWVDRIEPGSATDFEWLRDQSWIVGASFAVTLADALVFRAMHEGSIPFEIKIIDDTRRGSRRAFT